MNILIIQEGQYYLVDLDKIKPMELREVIGKVDDELAIVDTLEVTSLDDLLMQGLKAHRGVSQPVRTPTRTRSTAPMGSGRSSDELKAIREWAQAQELPVKAQGRIAADIIAKYDAAH